MKKFYSFLILGLATLTSLELSANSFTVTHKNGVTDGKIVMHANHATFTLAHPGGGSISTNDINFVYEVAKESTRTLQFTWASDDMTNYPNIKVTEIQINITGYMPSALTSYKNRLKATFGGEETVVGSEWGTMKTFKSSSSTGLSSGVAITLKNEDTKSRSFYMNNIVITYEVTPINPTVKNDNVKVTVDTKNPTLLDLSTCATFGDLIHATLSYAVTSSNSATAHISEGKFYATAAGTYTVKATVDAENNCHNSSNASFSINVEKIDAQILSAPTATPITYPAAISASQLEGGNASTDGSFAWNTDATQVLMPGTHSLDVLFTPSNANCYNSAATKVDLTVLPPTTYGKDSAIVCSGDSVLYNEQYYTAGQYQVTLTNYLGGDSIVTFTVNEFEPIKDTRLYDTIYIYEEIKIADVPYIFTEPGDTIVVDSTFSINGCDSVNIHEIHIKDKMTPVISSEIKADTITYPATLATSAIHAEVSVEGSFDWLVNKDTILLPGNHLLAVRFTPNDLGKYYPVDTMATIVVLPWTTYGEVAAQVCEGDSIEYHGKSYKAGVYEIKLVNTLGGDSVVTLTVNEFEPVEDIYVYDTTYVGDPIEVAGQVYTFQEAGDTTIIDSLTTIHGCDSVIYYEINIKEKGTPTAIDNNRQPCIDNCKFVKDGHLYIRRDDVLFDVLGNKVK